MRILQIVPALSLVYGGPSQMVVGLCAALAAAGAEVTILTTDANCDNGQAPLDVPLGVPISQDGYTVYYFRCAPLRRYKFSTGLLAWLAAHAHEYDLAHIHALFSPVSSAAAAIARRQGLPYILRPLGTLDPADLKKKARLKQLYAAAIERANIAGAAALHFTSPQEAQISERFGATVPSWVLPLGVALPEPDRVDIRAQLGLDPTRPLLLFMSRIDPKKGLDLLIPALTALQAQGQDFQFVMAGGNPQDPAYEADMRKQLMASTFKDRVKIPGFVTGGLKTALLQAADLVVLPSYYENFGISVAEALAVGTPVVISDRVDIWPDVQQAHAGWICKCEVESLTEALGAALSNADERQLRGQNAQVLAQSKYSWSAIAQQLLTAYDTIRR
jgi:glycosyltransferase involved in cell wall biosynthesis